MRYLLHVYKISRYLSTYYSSRILSRSPLMMRKRDESRHCHIWYLATFNFLRFSRFSGNPVIINLTLPSHTPHLGPVRIFLFPATHTCSIYAITCFYLFRHPVDEDDGMGVHRHPIVLRPVERSTHCRSLQRIPTTTDLHSDSHYTGDGAQIPQAISTSSLLKQT
jgi:hypothetical protein